MWQSLGLLGQVLACMAVPATILLILQAILMIIGADLGDGAEADTDGPGGADFDGDGFGDGGDDADADADDGAHPDVARVFTVRGITAFFAIGGWAGLAALKAGLRPVWIIQIALIAGVAAMILASALIKFILKMQSSGNIDYRNAVSQPAEVYITIPPGREKPGKVTMLLQERFVEIDAVTDYNEALKPYTKVRVIGLHDDGCLIVAPEEMDN